LSVAKDRFQLTQDKLPKALALGSFDISGALYVIASSPNAIFGSREGKLDTFEEQFISNTEGDKMQSRYGISRRESLQWLGVGGASLAAAGLTTSCRQPAEQPKPEGQETAPAESAAVVADRERRMQWWHAAKFGMFIHWGLYSVYGHHEWAMEEEGIPVAEYELLAKQFKPKLNAARAWAKLARQAGQKYMVMTSKHHEGFRTEQSAPRTRPLGAAWWTTRMVWCGNC
jgi:hypothetical protein